MARRTKVPDPVQANVLVLSRRRCCICFGVLRDKSPKKGQIAHLDGDPNNNDANNLAFLCLNHHDEFDGTSSQSKGLTVKEVKLYREELYRHFDDWRSAASREQFLNFLAATVTLDQMVDAAIKVGGSVVFYGPEHAYDVLVSQKKNYVDQDMLIPHLVALDRFASWGWLTFTEKEKKDKYGDVCTYITVHHGPVCQKVAQIIRERAKARGENLDGFDQMDAQADKFW